MFNVINSINPDLLIFDRMTNDGTIFRSTYFIKKTYHKTMTMIRIQKTWKKWGDILLKIKKENPHVDITDLVFSFNPQYKTLLMRCKMTCSLEKVGKLKRMP